VWGLGQLYSGKLADKYCKKTLLFIGMLTQGIALIGMTSINNFSGFIVLSSLLGIGTAIVYPTFLAAISDYTHPDQRPKSIGVFRLWRDLGYAIGALLTGLIADRFGLVAPIVAIGFLTIASSLIVKYRMSCSPKTSTKPLAPETGLKASRIQYAQTKSLDNFQPIVTPHQFALG
jgi:MFS family permease